MRLAVSIFILMIISLNVSIARSAALFDAAKKFFQTVNIGKEVIKKHGINVATGGIMLYVGVEEIATTDFSLPIKYSYMEKQIRSSWASLGRSLKHIEDGKSGQSRNFVCYIVFIIISLFIFVCTCCGIRNEIYIRPLQ